MIVVAAYRQSSAAGESTKCERGELPKIRPCGAAQGYAASATQPDLQPRGDKQRDREEIQTYSLSACFATAHQIRWRALTGDSPGALAAPGTSCAPERTSASDDECNNTVPRNDANKHLLLEERYDCVTP